MHRVTLGTYSPDQHGAPNVTRRAGRAQADIHIHKVLGQGAWGMVYLATAPAVPAPFALKILKTTDARRAAHTAQMIAEVTVQAALGAHPGITQARPGSRPMARVRVGLWPSLHTRASQGRGPLFAVKSGWPGSAVSS